MVSGSAAPPSRRALKFAVSIGVAIVAIAVATFGLVQYFAPKAPLAPNFTLIDQYGKPFTLANQRGHGVVLFFGYTHCPDVCPTTLSALARAKKKLGAAAKNIVVAFVTVDPRRDTRAVTGRYVHLFDPDFVGLTGTDAQLAPVYKAYRVYHQNLPAHSALGYLVAHSSQIDFIGTDGRFSGFGDWGDSPEQLATDMRHALS